MRTRRPASGLRRPPSSSSTSTAPGSDFKSTLSGSTGQHGPRFKKYRVQSSGVKEVPEEQVSMVEEINQQQVSVMVATEECLFASLDTGKAIIDSGASRTIVGEEIWKKWMDVMRPADAKEVKMEHVMRDFRFGDGNTVRSNYEVIFPAYVRGQKLSLRASVVPGPTPFLLARPTLEEWNVKQDYENAKMKVMNSE